MARLASRLVGLLMAATLAACSLPSGGKSQQTANFTGKTVTIVSGFAAGGPTDLFDRLLARHLSQHLPGKPTVIVQDMAGAGGAIALNTLYNAAKPDGLTVDGTSDPSTAWAIQDPGVKYAIDKFQWVAGIPEGSIEYVRADTGIKSAADFKGYGGSLVFGGLSPTSNKDLYARLFLQALRVKYRYVTGYSGVATVNQAMRSGEVTMADASLTDYQAGVRPMISSNIAVPIAQTGMLNDDGSNVVPDPRSKLPTMPEVITEVTGKAPSGSELQAMKVMAGGHNSLRSLLLPPKTPADIVSAWRKAVAATFADQGFKNDAQRQFGLELTLLSGDKAQAISVNMASELKGHPDVVQLLQRMAKTR